MVEIVHLETDDVIEEMQAHLGRDKEFLLSWCGRNCLDNLMETGGFGDSVSPHATSRGLPNILRYMGRQIVILAYDPDKVQLRPGKHKLYEAKDPHTLAGALTVFMYEQ